MIKKEFREIILPALARLSIILIPFIFQLFIGKFSIELDKLLTVLMISWGFAMVWIATNFGTQAFKSEYNDKAFEYLLSFPFSKTRIIMNKLVPRFIVLLVLIAVFETFFYLYYVLYSYGRISLQDSFFVPIVTIFFFLAGLSLSLIEERNRRASINFLVFLCFMVISLGIRPVLERLIMNQVKNVWGGRFLEHSFAVGAILILFILGLTFFSLYKTFDYRSIKSFGKKFLIRAVIPLLSLTVIAVAVLAKVIKV